MPIKKDLSEPDLARLLPGVVMAVERSCEVSARSLGMALDILIFSSVDETSFGEEVPQLYHDLRQLYGLASDGKTQEVVEGFCKIYNSYSFRADS